MDTHVAQFVCIVLVEDQVRASQQTEEQDGDQGRYDEHGGLLSEIYNAKPAKRMLPGMVLQRIFLTIRQGDGRTPAGAGWFPEVSGMYACGVSAG
jgi:hypothetical protein